MSNSHIIKKTSLNTIWNNNGRVNHIYEYTITLKTQIKIRKDHYNEKDIYSHLEKLGNVQNLKVIDIMKEELND